MTCVLIGVWAFQVFIYIFNLHTKVMQQMTPYDPNCCVNVGWDNHTKSRSLVKGDYHMSNERKPGRLVYIGDYAT